MVAEKKEEIIAYFARYEDAEIYCQCESNGGIFEDYVSGEGLVSDEPKTISFEDLMNQLLDGKFVSVEVNKEVFAQIRKYKGQSYIDNDEVKILNLDGITVKPRIRNIYLKPTTKNEEHITEGSDRVSEEIGGEEGVPTTPVESVLPDPVHPASDLPRGSDFSL